jgi:NAD(P)-dependent dehydrogenase (short-subunit alcohol dehydrogenase family)
MDLHLQGKTVLITGASQGIGRETALVLAEEGCHLVLVSRNAQRLNSLAETTRSQHGVSVSVVAADLSSTDEVEHVAASVAGIDVLVNNAGGESFNPGYIAGAAGNAALMAFTRALGKSAARDLMRVVGINPGPVSTSRNETMLRNRAQAEFGDENRWAELNAAMPYGRAATPGEIASAVAFLASSRSGYTNGTILTIDGGPA